LNTSSGDTLPGTFYGIGVGPGDPELITLKAKRVLAEVPVIFVPKKGDESTSYARSIIAGFIQPNQQVVELVFPMLKERERLAGYWELAVEKIREQLVQGLDCAFVNLGDPLLYGTFINIIDALRARCPQLHIEVIPGVSSITAAAAGALIPLAIDDDRLAIISGKCDDAFIKETLNRFDTVIFMKMYRVFDRVLAILHDLNLTGNAVYVENCTTDKERIVTDVTKLKGQKLDYFSLLIVRK
jgi:precorrin-2/cobalt-factor-2 C20-methyltransferase